MDMRKQTWRTAVSAAAIAAGAAIPMAAMADNPSILLNGSFESFVAGTNDAFTNTQLHAGMSNSRYPNNWSYTSGAGLCASGDSPFLGGGDVPDGAIAVYLQNSGTISQPITVTDAGTYEVSFRYAGRSSYTGGCIYVKIVDSSNAETTLASFACPVAVFRTAYAKTYLTPGTYTLKLEHAKSSSDSGDSIIDRVEMKLMDNLISNGSFEDYRNEQNNWSNTYKAFVSGTFVPEAWEYSGDLVMLKAGNPYNFTISDGDVAVAMRNKAVLTQQIVAPTAGVYEVSFQYAKRRNTGNVTMYACLGDELLGSVIMTTNVVRTAYFKANLEAGTSYTLSITNNITSNSGDTDYGIDRVSVVASTNLIHSIDKIEHVVEGSRVGIRTVVGTPFCIDGSGFENAWKVFVRYANRRIGFVVLQENVVAWLVFLDEIVFQEECIFV